jgi:hypothetical protein
VKRHGKKGEEDAPLHEEARPLPGRLLRVGLLRVCCSGKMIKKNLGGIVIWEKLGEEDMVLQEEARPLSGCLLWVGLLRIRSSGKMIKIIFWRHCNL